MPSVMSVTGLLDEGALGLTLPHEHLFVDLSCYWSGEAEDPAQRALFGKPVSKRNRELVLHNPWAFRDNTVLADLDSAIHEARIWKDCGGQTIVDVSAYAPMGRSPLGQLAVSQAAGVNVIMASGRYSEPSMDEAEKRLSVEDIEKRILDEFANGAGETGIRPGLLKAGFVDKLDKDPEIRTLRAVGRAQRKIGCAVSVHPHIWEPDSHRILDILEAEGCDLRRVILCHQDYLGSQADYLDSLAKRGAYIEIDTFGCAWINDRMWQQTDEEKIGFLARQIKLSNADHLLISGDMCLKVMLSTWGGKGYANIPQNVIPAMRAAGIADEVIHQITVKNPARVLCH